MKLNECLSGWVIQLKPRDTEPEYGVFESAGLGSLRLCNRVGSPLYATHFETLRELMQTMYVQSYAHLITYIVKMTRGEEGRKYSPEEMLNIYKELQ